VDKRVSLLGGFWHPKMGLVLYHFDEDGEPFIMTMPTLAENKAEDCYGEYCRSLKMDSKMKLRRDRGALN
jgi:hypothetical protein